MWPSGAAMKGTSFITSFFIRAWLPASLLRWKGTMGSSLPPTSFQLVILPA